MHRIASALLIAAVVLALNGGMLRDAFAQESGLRQPAGGNSSVQAAPVRSAKLLSLLVVLEALRQSPVRIDGPKV